MTVGTSNQTTLSYIKEVTPGTTPASPALQLLRFNGETLNASNSTVESDEIRDDRGVSDMALVDQSNSGEVTSEFSGGTYDEILRGALYADADWSTDTITGTTIAADATGFTDSGNGFISAGFEVGQFVKVSGFTDTTINGFYRVTAVAAGDLDVYPVPPATEAAGNSVTIESSNIKNGTTDHSYTFQKAFKDLATTTYMNFRGCRISSFGMQMSAGAKAGFNFGIVGLTSEITESAISGQSENAKTTTEIMNCVTTGNRVLATNAGITSALSFTQMNLTYDNATRELKAIGTLGSTDIRPGTIDAQATINPYFETKELLDEFLANNEFALSFELASGDGYTYCFAMPKCKFISQELNAGAKDQDMIINASAKLLIDSLSNVLVISKFGP